MLFGALLLGVAAIGHGFEAVATMTSSLQKIGSRGPAVALAEFASLVLGMLLVAAGLWRARIAPVWPALLIILIVPISGALPHGILQQLARSVILVVVTAWLAYALSVAGKSGVPGPGTGTGRETIQNANAQAS